MRGDDYLKLLGHFFFFRLSIKDKMIQDCFQSEFHRLQNQFLVIQEQQRFQTSLIEQFQQELKSYREKYRYQLSNDDEDRSIPSPLDLSSTSIKSDEEQSQNEGEMENPQMFKVKKTKNYSNLSLNSFVSVERNDRTTRTK